MNHFRKLYSHRVCIAVLSVGLFIVFSDPAWSTLTGRNTPYPYQVSDPSSDSPGIHLSRRQKGPSQMDEDSQRNWKTYQGLTPDDKAGLRDKSHKWQSLSPEKQNEMRRRMERYRELPPQDQDRYQKHYKQWQSLPPEDRNRIRDRLRNWDSLSPQEKEDVRRRFQKR